MHGNRQKYLPKWQKQDVQGGNPANKSNEEKNMARYALKPIKTILKKHHDGEVSDDTVIYARDVLLVVTEFLAEESVKDFNEMNRRRQEQGLPILKRLDMFTLKNVFERFFKQVKDKNIGEVGNVMETLLCQDGAKDV